MSASSASKEPLNGPRKRMYLKAVELFGFKSFHERCTLLFPSSGLSVIVGPNGCGKSNIVEAILWALGEMRPSLLRSKQMEDVIFNGTDIIRPSNMAEVSLVFETQDQEELRITRRLYRSGISEYLLNRKPCRLKDIRDIFLGTGLGTNTYAVIPQGEIEALITAPPQHLRLLIEEAAGISRVHEREKETLKKIEETQRNLEKILPLLEEVQREAESLKEEASKAQRFKVLKEKLREIEIKEIALNLLKLEDELALVLKTEKTLRDELWENEKKKAQLETEVHQIRERLLFLSEELKSLEKQTLILEGKKEKEEERLRAILLEKENKKGQIANLENNLEETEKSLIEFKQRKDKIINEIQHIEKELRDKEALLIESEKQLKDLELKRREFQEKRNLLKKEILELEALKVRLSNSLKEAEEKQFLLDIKESKLTKEIAELSQNIENLEKETFKIISEKEVLLNQLKNEEDIVPLLDENQKGLEKKIYLKNQELSRISGEIKALKSQEETLKNLQTPFEGSSQELKAILENPQRFGLKPLKSLGELLEAKPGYEKAVEAILGEGIKALVVEDLKEALEVIEKTRGEIPLLVPRSDLSGETEISKGIMAKEKEEILRGLFRDVELVKELPSNLEPEKEYVTPEGLFLDRRGFIWPKRTFGILERKNLLKEILNNLKDLSEKKAFLEMELINLKKEEESIRKKRNEVENTVKKLKKELDGIESLQKEIQGKYELVKRKREVLLVELEEIKEQKTMWKKTIRENDEKLKDIQEKYTKIKAHYEHNETQTKNIEAERRKIEERINLLKIEIATLKERLERKKDLLEELLSRIKKAENEIKIFKNDLEKTQKRLKELDEEEKTIKVLLENTQTEIRTLSNQLSQLKEKESEEAKILKRSEKNLQSLKERIESIKSDLSQLIIKEETLKVQMEHFKDILRENHKIEPKAAKEILSENPLPFNYEEIKRQIKMDLEKLGEVFLGAIEEYEEIKIRLNFLQAQKADLERSLRNLQDSLEEMRERSKEVFRETFERVREIFRDLVGKLFEGGKGDLVLQESSEPSVKILIEPKGKRLKSLELLSGGEKSLASIAFVLSLFFLNPAPFCIMDEVDSALDEMNIERFLSLLTELKDQYQFILITHQPKTIEEAQYVYGITMETPGISKVISLRMQ